MPPGRKTIFDITAAGDSHRFVFTANGAGGTPVPLELQIQDLAAGIVKASDNILVGGQTVSISGDTNLAVTSPIVLTGDTLSFDTSVNFSWTGNHSWGDNDVLSFGAGTDGRIYSDGTNMYIVNENDVGIHISSVNVFGTDIPIISFRSELGTAGGIDNLLYILGSSPQLFFSDTALTASANISYNSVADTLSFGACTGGIILNPGTNVDGIVQFQGTTNSGRFNWMEDEDYFLFYDDIVPQTDSSEDLGTTSLRWRELFVDDITCTADVAAATGTFTGDVTVSDEAYGAGWNGSTEVPTKNAVYDKIETLSAGSGLGYVFKCTCPATAGVADATDYFIGAFDNESLDTDENERRVYIPVAGTINVVQSTWKTSGTLPSSESVTLSIRINNTTDYAVSSAINLSSASITRWNNYSMNGGSGISVSQGDYFTIKITTPTWTTNPSTLSLDVNVFVE